jgi:protein TonB
MDERMATKTADESSYWDDRLIFSLFLALVLHAVLVLGISFDYEQHTQAAETLEVTLARTQASKPLSEADFLAQEDQEGSGTLEEAHLLTTTEIADFQDSTIREVIPVDQAPSAPQLQTASTEILSTTSQAPLKHKQQVSEDEKPKEQVTPGPKKTLLERSLEIASLEAKLDSQRQAYAKRPRIYRLTAVSTMKAEDAVYVHNWLRRIEHIGNLNYPEEAKRRKIYGHLRLLVAIKPDGKIKQVEILQSSGHVFLDDAAKRIVKLAAPFSPFPPAMRQQVDVLEIIRTWEFQRNHSLTSY